VPHPIRDPGTNRVQYHMIHATDHPAAIEFMRWATRIPTAELARQAQLPM
jgi:hypothetical protein